MLGILGRIKTKIWPSPLQQARGIGSRFIERGICVDVGASYYAHPDWSILCHAPGVRWIAVDPNANNLEYLGNWAYKASLRTVDRGLSRTGGSQTLYLTSVDSGSSLLEPVVSESNKHRTDADYFFPYRELSIETMTLAALLEEEQAEWPIAVKLDTQGSEFDILEGMTPDQWERTVCVELEATLMAEPYYSNMAKFHDVLKEMEQKGFELMRLKPIPGSLPAVASDFESTGALVECDAVFFRRYDQLIEANQDSRLFAIALYASYQLWGDALALTRVAMKHASGTVLSELESLAHILSPEA